MPRNSSPQSALGSKTPVSLSQNKSCLGAGLGYLTEPFWWLAANVVLALERETVLKMPGLIGAGGQNNTKYNPVFRGMVCAKHSSQAVNNGKHEHDYYYYWR